MKQNLKIEKVVAEETQKIISQIEKNLCFFAKKLGLNCFFSRIIWIFLPEVVFDFCICEMSVEDMELTQNEEVNFSW